MSSTYGTATNSFTTQDWLEASKGLKLTTYDPTSQTASCQYVDQQQSAVFGAHIMEAVEIVKDWAKDKT
jgi:hypothetical protein